MMVDENITFGTGWHQMVLLANKRAQIALKSGCLVTASLRDAELDLLRLQ